MAKKKGNKLPAAPPAQLHRIRSQPESNNSHDSNIIPALVSPVESPHSTNQLKQSLKSGPNGGAPPPAVVAHIQRPRLPSIHSHESNESDDSEESKHVHYSKHHHRLSNPSSPLLQPPSQSPILPQSPLLTKSSPLSFAEKRRIGKEAAAAREMQIAEHPIANSISARWQSIKQKFSSLNDNRGFWLVVYSILLLVTSVGNSIYFKKMINQMENYVYFLNQFTTIIFAPIFFSFVAYQFYFTEDITKEMTQFPKIKFFWMGAFDSVAGVLTLFGAVHTSGSNQALLTNAVIPVTMALSYVILHERFRGREYVGSLIIMLGIVVVLLPQMFPDQFGSDAPDEGEGDAKDMPFFNFLFVLSVIPGALSSIYKELAFVDADIDANYLQAWVALWQTLFGFLLVPLNTMSFLGPQSVPFDQLWSSFVDGMWCLCGVDTLTPPDCTRHHISQSTLPACDHCEGAFIPIMLYIVFNLLFNVFTVLLIKYGSATLMFIIMTLRMPMVQWAFSIPAFNNPPDVFGWASGAGLVVILAGLVCYRWPAREPDELPATQPLLTRAKTTGMMRTGDYGDLERSVILPVLGFNQVFAARHFAQRQSLKLARTGSQIRSSFYGKLGVISSPMTTRSPRVNLDQPRASPPRNSSRALTRYGAMDDSVV